MAGRPYLGIPRSLIPWAPRIDEDACIGCGDCLDTCPNGVFSLDDAQGKMRVTAPDNCVVLCDKCAAMCAVDAIAFPDKSKTRALLVRLVREVGKPAAAPTEAGRSAAGSPAVPRATLENHAQKS